MHTARVKPTPNDIRIDAKTVVDQLSGRYRDTKVSEDDPLANKNRLDNLLLILQQSVEQETAYRIQLASGKPQDQNSQTSPADRLLQAATAYANTKTAMHTLKKIAEDGIQTLSGPNSRVSFHDLISLINHASLCSLEAQSEITEFVSNHGHELYNAAIDSAKDLPSFSGKPLADIRRSVELQIPAMNIVLGRGFGR